MSSYFPKPYKYFGGDVKVKLDLPNYAAKADLKGATGADSPNLALKPDLDSLKAELNKIDLNQLKTAPIDLSNIVYNDAVKKTVNDQLVI